MNVQFSGEAGVTYRIEATDDLRRGRWEAVGTFVAGPDGGILYDEVPRESAAWKRYLQKFDEQETEMDQLHERLKSLQQQEHDRRVTYEEYLTNLTVE